MGVCIEGKELRLKLSLKAPQQWIKPSKVTEKEQTGT